MSNKNTKHGNCCITPLGCCFDYKDKKQTITPFGCCFNETSSNCDVITPLGCCFGCANSEQVITPLGCCFGCGDNEYIITPIMVGSQKKQSKNRTNWLCLFGFCLCNPEKNIEGETDDVRVNQYILDNKIRTQQHEFRLFLGIPYHYQKGPIVQRMSDTTVKQIVEKNRAELKEIVIDKVQSMPMGDGPNLATMIMNYV